MNANFDFGFFGFSPGFTEIDSVPQSSSCSQFICLSFDEWSISQKADKMLGSDDKHLGFNDKKNRSRDKVMSATAEATELFKRSFPQRRYGKLENVFYHAVRFIDPRVEKDFSLRRARSIWEGTARRIDADEMDAIRLAEIEELRRDREDTKGRLVEINRKIAMADTAYFGRSVEQNRRATDSMG